MLNDSTYTRVLRRVIKLRDSMATVHGGDADAIMWSNLVLKRLLFLRLLPPAVSSDLGVEKCLGSEAGVSLVLNPSPALKKLRLFTIPLPNIGTNNDSISLLDAFVKLDLRPRSGGIIPDYRILLLGSVAEALKSKRKRKWKGVFYTPFKLSQCICSLAVDAFMKQHKHHSQIEMIKDLLSLRILDNACGGGTFLIAMLETLLKRTLSQSDDNRVTQIEVNGQIINLGQSGEIAAHLIANVLHGHDLDKDAVDVTEALLFLALSHISETYPLLSFAQNLDVRDTLIHEQDSPSYDIIIGNPPYVRLTRKDSEYRELIKARYSTRREYNVHALFVEESLRQLRPGGVLSYLVHKNLLTLDTYYDLRRTLLESYNLIHLSDCGPGQFRGVTAETAILVTGKGPKTPSMNLTLSRFDGSIGGCSPSAAFNIDEYNTLISPWNKRFVIGLTQDSVAFLREVENHPRLDSRVEIRRGIETGNNARFLSENPTGRGDWRPVLRGRDVSMYEVSLNMYLDYNRSALAKPGKSDLKVTPKVIIQQNSRSPIAYYDRGRFLVLNSITYLAGADEDVLKAICVILNSTFISWFFRTVMTNNAGLTVNLLPNNVGRIPYPHSPEVATLSSLCDILAEIKSNSERYQADFDTWHKIIAECAVLESYLPGLLGDCRVTRSLEKYRGSFHSLSKSQVASIVGTARKQLKKLNLPLVMASDHWML